MIYRFNAISKKGSKLICQDRFCIDDRLTVNDTISTAWSLDVEEEGPDEIHMMAVADGVSLSDCGALAAQTVCRELMKRYRGMEPGPGIMNGIVADAARSISRRGGETTVSVALFNSHTLYTYNLGDSPIYIIRGDEALPVYREDTVAARKAADNEKIKGVRRLWMRPGKITERDKNILTKCMSAREDRYDGFFAETALKPGDIVMICSDALTGAVDIDTIVRSIKEPEALAETAIKKDDHDNLTLLTVEIPDARPLNVRSTLAIREGDRINAAVLKGGVEHLRSSGRGIETEETFVASAGGDRVYLFEDDEGRTEIHLSGNRVTVRGCPVEVTSSAGSELLREGRTVTAAADTVFTFRKILTLEFFR